MGMGRAQIEAELEQLQDPRGKLFGELGGWGACKNDIPSLGQCLGQFRQMSGIITHSFEQQQMTDASNLARKPCQPTG